MIVSKINELPANKNYKLINRQQDQNLHYSSYTFTRKKNINNRQDQIYFNGYLSKGKGLFRRAKIEFKRPLTYLDTKDIIEARKKQARMVRTNLINTPEREKIRKLALDKFYGTGAVNKNKQIYFVLGPSGSGKSTVVVDPLAEQTGSFIADPDLIKEIIFDIEDKERPVGVVHEESRNINTKVMEKAMKNGDNIIYPTTGRNIEELLHLYDKFKKANYDIHLRYVDVSPNEAAKRAIERFNKTGRFVDPHFVLNVVGTKSKSNFNHLKELRTFKDIEIISNEKASNCTFRKNQIESVFDFYYAKLNKIQLKDFSSIKDFNATIGSKTRQAFRLKQYKCKNERTTNEARRILGEWKNYLESDDWKNFLESKEWKGEQENVYYNKATPALNYIIFSSMVKNLTPMKNNLPIDLDIEILKKTAKTLKDNLEKPKPAKFNFHNVYKENMRLKYTEGVEKFYTDSKIGYWMYIPSKSHSLDNFDINKKRLYLNSCNTWCVRRHTKAGRYLENGDCYLFMVKDKAKVLIKVVNGQLNEIQGEINNWTIPIEYLEEVKTFAKKLNLSNRIYDPETLYGKLMTAKYRYFFKNT